VASATGRQERRGNEASAPKRHFAAVFANEPISEENTFLMWFYRVEGGLVPSKISGVGTNFFGLLVHVFPGPNKQRALKLSTILS